MFVDQGFSSLSNEGRQINGDVGRVQVSTNDECTLATCHKSLHSHVPVKVRARRHRNRVIKVERFWGLLSCGLSCAEVSELASS